MNKECCPKFEPEKWDNKKFTWKNKPFITESIPQIFHIPFFPMIGMKITKMWRLAEESKKTLKNKSDTLILFQDPSAFKSNIYVSVTGKVQNANNTGLSGIFISKVYEGPYNAIPKFVKDMNEFLKKKGESIPKDSEYFIHYAYCPKCEKKYGHHYMVLFAKVK